MELWQVCLTGARRVEEMQLLAGDSTEVGKGERNTLTSSHSPASF